MKKGLLPTVLVISSGLAGSGPSQALTTSTTLDVTALVGAACTVSTSPVVFNVIDQAVDTLASGSITVTCNSGTFFTIALDAGMNYNVVTQMRNVMDGLGNTLEYDLGSNLYMQPWGDGGLTNPAPPISEFATGMPDVFSVDGVLLGGQFKPNGVYNDVVNVTVTY